MLRQRTVRTLTLKHSIHVHEVFQMMCMLLQRVNKEDLWPRNSRKSRLCAGVLLVAEQSYPSSDILHHSSSVLFSVLLQSVLMVSHVSNTCMAQVRSLVTVFLSQECDCNSEQQLLLTGYCVVMF